MWRVRAVHFNFLPKKQAGGEIKGDTESKLSVCLTAALDTSKSRKQAPSEGRSSHFKTQDFWPWQPLGMAARAGPFNTFGNDLDDRTACSQELCGWYHTDNVAGQVQRDLDRLDKRVDRDLLQFSGDKCYTQHLRQKNLRFNTSWGNNRLQSGFAEKYLGWSHYFLLLSQRAIRLWGRFLGRESWAKFWINIASSYWGWSTWITKATVKFSRLSLT